MAISINFNGVTLLEPGSYSDLHVIDSSVAEPALGVVALIGESDAGIAFSAEAGISAVSYGPDEFAAIQDKYGSGELVDAAALAISPSNDQAIKGGAQELLIMKTNPSVAAAVAIATNYGSVSAKKAGADGNNISVQIAIVTSQAVITVSHLTQGVSEISDALGGNAVMTLLCTDASSSAATATLSATALTTVVTGGTVAQNLNVPLKQFNTIKQLVDFVNAQPGYSAALSIAQMGSKPVSQLDQATAADIKTAAYAFKKDAFEVRDFFAKSKLVNFVPTAFSGLPIAMPKAFLSGGARGATSQAAFQACLDALLKRRINFIAPLFSRDATDDIADSLTDAGSSYTIDAVHAAVRSHCNQASTIKGRKERQAFVAYKGPYATAEDKSANINAARVQLVIQDVDVSTPANGVQSKQPHMLAVISAGMKASAPIGLTNQNKQPAVFGFSHQDFDPETQADKAISANIAFLKKSAQGGFVFDIDNSTYGQTENAWIFNRPSVLYAADFASYVIRLNTEVFVGKRNSDVTEETVKNKLVSVMDALRDAGVIVGDKNTGGRGYKDLKIKIAGSIIRISVTLALVENYEFILSDISVQRVG